MRKSTAIAFLYQIQRALAEALTRFFSQPRSAQDAMAAASRALGREPLWLVDDCTTARRSLSADRRRGDLGKPREPSSPGSLGVMVGHPRASLIRERTNEHNPHGSRRLWPHQRCPY